MDESTIPPGAPDCRPIYQSACHTSTTKNSGAMRDAKTPIAVVLPFDHAALSRQGNIPNVWEVHRAAKVSQGPQA